jgi:hypothetical protein
MFRKAKIGDIVQINFYDWHDMSSGEKYTKVRYAIVFETPDHNWCYARYFDNEDTCSFTRDYDDWYDSKSRPTIIMIT